jgi:hypothetical protein
MKARIIKSPKYYIVETWVWYWPFWTFRNLSCKKFEAEEWANYYVNPDITEVK